MSNTGLPHHLCTTAQIQTAVAAPLEREQLLLLVFTQFLRHLASWFSSRLLCLPTAEVCVLIARGIQFNSVREYGVHGLSFFVFIAALVFWPVPIGSFSPVLARNSEVLGSNPDWVGYLSLGLCKYSALNCSKVRSVQCCIWYCACTINNPWGYS